MNQSDPLSPDEERALRGVQDLKQVSTITQRLLATLDRERLLSEVRRDVIQRALARIDQSGGVDGEHHKAWVLDQVVRILTGSDEAYAAWVKAREDEGYAWDPGIAP